jgi:predicted HicB family RNase H-like nuclease
MKTIRICSIVIASFALTGAMPAVAGLAPPSAPRPGAQVIMAEADVSVADRATYAQKAQAELQQWRVKLDQFGERAKADSNETRKSMSEDLNKAWTKARDASARLETASAADWESAKAAFKKASDELAALWAKVRAEVK